MKTEERMAKARPLVRVDALCFLQCFDAVGWYDRKDIWPVKTYATYFLSTKVRF